MIDKLKTLLKNIFAVIIFSALTLLFFINLRKDEIKAQIDRPKIESEIVVIEEKDESIFEELPELFDSYVIDEDEVIIQEPEPVQEVSEIVPVPEVEIHDETNTDDIYKLYEEDLPDNIILDEIIEIKKTPPEDAPKTDDHIVIPVKKPDYFETPMIAIVIDDMGISKKRTSDINSLNFPITSSFLTYGKDLDEQISSSHKAGHEIIAHIPMEAYSTKDVAPDVLKLSMSKKNIQDNLNEMLDIFAGIKGINNHMGSKFTESSKHMDEVMKVLKKRNLFFLDSKTSSKSVGSKMAKKHNTSYVHRHVFLDNNNDLKYILKQLETTERIAKKRGYAIAIGHPKTQTYEALKIWLPTIEQKGFKLVHISDIVEKIN